MADRIRVAKTYKLFIGGAFPRSESGRTYQVVDRNGHFLANAALGSRKDARDAVVAARKGFGPWSTATAYNRGQVIYRIAEMLEGRRADFAELVGVSEGVGDGAARETVDRTIDRLVHYAGWTDKIAAVFGGANPVAGPFFAFSVPEPTGIVAAVAPSDDSLLGLVSVIAPIICSGNTVVVIASESRPLPAVALTEVLATSDLPTGVVNLLTGSPAEIFGWLAEHGDVNALDLTGVELAERTQWERAAAGTVKRVFAPASVDFSSAPGTARLRAFLETKSVWHPTGSLSLSGGSSY
jgi:acyl-CoA reductase-like NAD-dependent aldehyde dehydrogenase